MLVLDKGNKLGCKSANAYPLADELLKWCGTLDYKKHDFIVDTTKLKDNRFCVNMLDYQNNPIENLKIWLQGVLHEVYGIRASINVSQVNRYEPHEICEWHSDSHLDAITLTLGGSRNLLFRKKSEKTIVDQIDLGHGDIFVFNSHYQSAYEHGIMEESSKSETRYLFLFVLDLWSGEDPCKMMYGIPKQYKPSGHKLLDYKNDCPEVNYEIHTDCFDIDGTRRSFPYQILNEYENLWFETYRDLQRFLSKNKTCIPDLLKKNLCD